MEEGYQSSSERQVEIPKRGLSEIRLTDLVIDAVEPPKKMGRFQLSDDSSNTREINSDSADHTNKYINTFVSNQRLIGYFECESYPF